MRVSHSFPAISTVFDDSNLVSCAGLAPTMALAQRAGLADLVSSTLTLKAIGGVNAHLKVPALVAGRARRAAVMARAACASECVHVMSTATEY